MSAVWQKTESSAEPPASNTAQGPAASSPARRAIGVDVARGVALIGMIAVHSFPAQHVDGAMSWPYAVFGGRAAALFAVLAGVSIAFVEKRSRGQLRGRTLAADRVALVVRGLLILLMGLLLGHLDTPIITIIPYFGILFILALPFYARPSWFLLLSALVFATLGPVLRHLVNGTIPQQANPEADYTLVTAANEPGIFIVDMLITGFYPAILWMAYLCVGMVMGRQVLTSKKTAYAFLGWGAALAASTWVVSKALTGSMVGVQQLVVNTPSLTGEEIVELLVYGPDLEMMPNTTWWWLAAVSPYSETPLNVLHNLGAAVAAVGLILLLSRSGRKFFSPFAAVGTMTLTLYSAHCVVLLLEILEEDRPVVSLWIQTISIMLFAMVWRSAVGKGPLESIIAESSDWARRRILKPWKRSGNKTRVGDPAGPGTDPMMASTPYSDVAP